jgi:hypothetical protein
LPTKIPVHSHIHWAVASTPPTTAFNRSGYCIESLEDDATGGAVTSAYISTSEDTEISFIARRDTDTGYNSLIQQEEYGQDEWFFVGLFNGSLRINLFGVTYSAWPITPAVGEVFSFKLSWLAADSTATVTINGESSSISKNNPTYVKGNLSIGAASTGAVNPWAGRIQNLKVTKSGVLVHHWPLYNSFNLDFSETLDIEGTANGVINPDTTLSRSNDLYNLGTPIAAFDHNVIRGAFPDGHIYRDTVAYEAIPSAEQDTDFVHLREVAIDAERVDHIGLVIEPEGANLILDSDDLTAGANWSYTGVAKSAPSAWDRASPLGGTEKFATLSGATTAGALLTQDVTLAGSGGPITGSFYLSGTSSTEPEANSSSVMDIGGSFVNLDPESFDSEFDIEYVSSPAINRYSAIAVSTSTSVSLDLVNDTESTDKVGAGTGIYVWAPQLEARKYPTSYIPPGVTRGCEHLEFGGGHFINPKTTAAGAFVLEVIPSANQADLGVVGNNTNGQAVPLIHGGMEAGDGFGQLAEIWGRVIGISTSAGSSGIFVGNNAGTFIPGTTGLLTAHQKSRFVFMWDGTDFHVYHNGAFCGSVAFTGWPHDFQRLIIGGDGGVILYASAGFGGHIRGFRQYTSAVSAAECAVLSAVDNEVFS